MRPLRILLRALPLAFCVANLAHAQMPDTSLWVTTGDISSAVRIGNALYIAGDFSRVGPATGCAVPFDATSGQPRLPFPRVPGNVNAIVSDGLGGWFVGGAFASVEGTSRRNLVHVLSSGQLAPWAPDPDSEVFALALSGSTLYVGGRFEHLGGAARYKLGAVDVSLGLATAFDPHPAVPYFNSWPFIRALAVAPGVVYAGGYFLTIGGATRSWLAALDPATGVATLWDAAANGQVLAIAPAGGTVYVGGYFSSIGGQPRGSLAELDATSAAATAWNPSANAAVLSFALTGSRLYAGGDFSTMNGLPRGGMAAFDRATGSLAQFNPALTRGTGSLPGVTGIAADGGTIYAAGDFDQAGGAPRMGVAALDATTGAVQSWDAHLNERGRALAVADGTVYVGGLFYSVGGVTRSNLAALDLVTGHPTAWAPSANDRVTDMVSDGTSLWIGGYFTIVNGDTHHFLARLDVASGAAASWNPGADNVVSCLALTGTRLYVGGYPATIAGGTLGSVNAQTGVVDAWYPVTTGGPVNQIAPDPAAGAVTVASQGGFWRFRDSNGSLLWSASIIDGTPYTVTQLGGTLYVGGNFYHVNSAPRNNLAALDAATGALLPWDPSASNSVTGLANDGLHLHATGWFSSIGGETHVGYAVLDATTGAPTGDAVQLNGQGYRVFPAGADVFVTGLFSTANKFLAHGFARLPAAPPLDAGGTPERAGALWLKVAPMPVSSQADLTWSLPHAGRIWLDVTDAQGRRVTTPFAGEWFAAGPGTYTLRTRGWAPGVYLVRLRAGSAQVTRRIVSMR